MNNKAHLRPKDYDSNGDIIPMSMKEEKGDLISREALRKAFHGRIYYFDKSSWDEANALIDNAPTVENITVFCENADEKTIEELKAELKRVITELRPQGEWGKWVISEIRCPNCLEYYQTDCYSTEELKKCPNCGAKMKKGGAE